jgi:hypothetical protein
MHILSIPLALCALFGILVAPRVSATQVVVGTNVVNPYLLNLADQDDLLNQLQTAGVHVIRASITLDAKGIAFARRAWQKNIRIEWLIYRFGGYNPFGKVPLSAADPEQFRATFGPVLAQLEAEQISIAGFELGNEINLSKTNPSTRRL